MSDFGSFSFHLSSLDQENILSFPGLFRHHPDPSMNKTYQNFFENNLWIAPDCQTLAMRQKIHFDVNGFGGDLDQSYLYFGTEGAANWLAMSHNKDYLSTKWGMSLSQIVSAVCHHWKRNKFESKHIHLIGLGSGTGSHEIEMVNRLLDEMPDAIIHLYLLDLSSDLLNTSHFKATQSLGHKPNVTINQLYANFENLSSYEPIIKMAQESNELILLTMFGYTFCNLKAEQLFVRNALRVFPDKTLFLLDVPLSKGPADDQERILAADPRLLGEANQQHAKEHTDFLTVSFRQYRSNLKSIDLHRKLDYTSCFPGSYCIDFRVLINGHIPFSVMRVKRYEPVALANMFRKEGWGPLTGFPYGKNEDPRLLYLLAKGNHESVQAKVSLELET